MKPIDPRLLKYPGVRRHLVASAVLALATASALVAQAAGLAFAIAGAFDGRLESFWIGLAVTSIALRGALTWIESSLSARAAARLKAQIRREVLDDIVDPRRVGPRPSSSATATLLGQGIDGLDPYVGRYLAQTVLAMCVPASIIVASLFVDPLSGLIIGLTVPLVVGFLVLIGLQTRDEIGRRWSATERLGRHFADVLDGLVLLTGFGRSQTAGLRDSGERHRRATLRSLRLAFTSSLVLDLFATLSVALVAVEVGLRVVHGHLALATGLFVLFLAPEAFTPIRRLGAAFHDGTAGLEAVDAVFAVLDHPTHPGTLPAPSLSGTPIVVEDLRVEYDGRQRPGLAVDHLVIEPGRTTVVSGSSGSGKSTLFSVLLGFELSTRGTVRVGNTDLTAIDPQSWRRRIAWVPQVPGLIEGSIADNVTFGVEADRHAVERALFLAGAADLSPDRVIREGRSDVSAGERRRIGVARALLRVEVGGAELVLLDEPTAGLDASRESTVLESLRALGVTVVVASHRSMTFGVADRVVVLDDVAREALAVTR